ncbi:amidohydrolase family protein [Rhodococcus aetherivorans]|uniref:amidohydrolase family protein n=1 Tax=Rhodococcus aetherivorans TaxID=191292 RepID=UPI00163ACEC5|nr:amidohydrolase family protein [Rhodococcus aetherivorans]MBC2592441.1 amidohydrolase [Rhodococcus aetherivorans]
MTRDRIDTHQHYIPAPYRREMEANHRSAGGWPTPNWSVEGAIALMDTEEIATGILSVSAPGTHFGNDAQARDLSREVNEFGAEIVKDRPDRFGLFASLPLPDVDGALAEVAYAFDKLDADGVVLMSNVHGTYLGDPRYEPLWAELNERKAVVFIHPDAPPIEMLDGMPSPLLDFPFDTTRTAVHMVAMGVMKRHSKMKVILSHGGGFLPYAAYRFTGAAAFHEGITPEGILEDLRKFYFDTALSSTPASLPSLTAFADPTHITYGSDYPFAPSTRQFNEMLDHSELDEATKAAINRGNAELLFPRLARSATRTTLPR